MDIDSQTKPVSSFSSSPSFPSSPTGSKKESNDSKKSSPLFNPNTDVVYQALQKASEGWENMLAAVEKNELNFDDDEFVFVSTNGKEWKNLSRTLVSPGSVCDKMIKAFQTLHHDEGCRIIYGFNRSSGIIEKRIGINVNLQQSLILVESDS